MKYSEATKLIKGLSKKYSINNDKWFFELIYKSNPIAWVDKQEQFNFGRANILDSKFAKIPYSHKLWMILAELAMTPLNERKEYKWNVIVGNDAWTYSNITCWSKSDSIPKYALHSVDSYSLKDDRNIFTDSEFNDLIKYIKTSPDGEWQVKVAEHGKTLVKGE